MAKAKKVKEIGRSDLIKVAKDLCNVCELEDSKGGAAIKTGKTVKAETLKEKIIEAAGFVEEDDMGTLSELTVNVFKTLDCTPDFNEENEEEEPEENEEEEPEENEEEEPEEDEEEEPEEDEEEEPEEKPKKTKKKTKTKKEKKEKKEVKEEVGDEEIETDLNTLVQQTGKLVELKAIVAEHPEFKKLRKGLDGFKGLQGPRQLKPKMLKILGIEDAPKVKAPKKTVSAIRRPDVIAETIKSLGKKGFTMSDLLSVSDDNFVEQGGSSNPTATSACTYMTKALVNFDILSVKEGIYKLK